MNSVIINFVKRMLLKNLVITIQFQLCESFSDLYRKNYTAFLLLMLCIVIFIINWIRILEEVLYRKIRSHHSHAGNLHL